MSFIKKLRDLDEVEGYPVVKASNFVTQWLGLMFRKDFSGEMSFTFARSQIIFMHTFFMRFPIDVTFFDEEDNVIKKIRNMKPWRVLVVRGVKKFVERKSVL